MKLIIESWRKFLAEQEGGFEMPPGYKPDDYGGYKPHPVDDKLADDSKYYVREGNKIVYLGGEFTDEEIDLLRYSVRDFMKGYPEPDPKGRREIYLHARKSKLEDRFKRLPRRSYSSPGKPDVSIGKLQPEAGSVETTPSPAEAAVRRRAGEDIKVAPFKPVPKT